MRIKARRVAKGLTQEQLANKAQVNQSYISGLENGHKKRPSFAVLESLAAALDCTVRDLTGETPHESLAWFWKAKLSTLSDGELLELRRATIERRAQWMVQQVIDNFGMKLLTDITGLLEEQIVEIQQGTPALTPDEADKLARLDPPANFLLAGDPGPRDDDLKALINSPYCSEWLRLFRECEEANILPSTLKLLQRAAMEARKSQ